MFQTNYLFNLAKDYWRLQIKDDEMVGACSMHVGEEKYIGILSIYIYIYIYIYIFTSYTTIKLTKLRATNYWFVATCFGRIATNH